MLLPKHNSFCYIWHMLSKISSGQQLTPHTLGSFFYGRSRTKQSRNYCKSLCTFMVGNTFIPFILWTAFWQKIVDFDPTFIASIFSASTASLGFQIKKKKDTIVDNKNNKVGIKWNNYLLYYYFSHQLHLLILNRNLLRLLK